MGGWEKQSSEVGNAAEAHRESRRTFIYHFRGMMVLIWQLLCHPIVPDFPSGLQQGAAGGDWDGCCHHANNHPGGLFQQ